MTITNTNTTVPTVGMGATIYGYSDSHAATVVAVSKSGKRVTLRRDKATLLNGCDSGEGDALRAYPGGFCAHVEGVQRYSFEPGPAGYEETFSLRTLPNGETRWIRVGESLRSGSGANIGTRYHHYDYNF